MLPDDVAVVEARPCHRLYNPRFDSEKKLYRYVVAAGETRDPLLRRRAWYLGPRFARRDVRERRRVVEDYFDLDLMRDAAARLVGEHDFQAFRSSSDGREKTRRTLFRVDITSGHEGRADLLAIEVEGDAFMKNMVRILAGTLVDIARHHLEVSCIDAMLGPDGDRSQGGATAPPHGLTLQRIWPLRGDHPRAFEGRP